MNTEKQEQMPQQDVAATAGAGAAEMPQPSTGPDQDKGPDQGEGPDQDEGKANPDQAGSEAIAPAPNLGRAVDDKYEMLRPVLVEDDPGHRYMVPLFEKPDRFLLLEFIKKTPVPEDPTLLKTDYDGTTNEAVLEAVLMRLRHLQSRFPCQENLEAISGVVHALEALYRRTLDRQSRGVEGRQMA